MRIAALVGIWLLAGGLASAQTSPVVIRVSQALDGRGGVLKAQRIVLQGDRIVRIEADDGGEATYDLRNLTVMPGTIDTHVHLGQYINARGRATSEGDTPPQSALARMENAYVTLMGGVTTVQSIGSASDIDLRDAINRRRLPGPRILTSLAWVTEGTPEKLRETVRQRVKDGADLVKVFASRSAREGGGRTLDDAQLSAACSEAKALGKRTIAHAHSRDSIEAAIRQGCGAIAHGTYSNDETFKLMVDRGVYFIPELLVIPNYLENKPKFLGIGNYTEEGFTFMEKNLPILMATFRRATNVPGLKLLFGTDAVAMAHGRNHEEYVYRVRDGGQDPMKAFVSAQSLAAESLGLGDQIGSLAPGFQADIIALDGDPLTDITAVRRVVFVMKGGNVYKNVAPARRATTPSAQDHERRDVKPHASSEFVPFSHSSGLFSLQHPSDWKAHEMGARTNIGADDGLVKGERGFRTVYGVIAGAIEDPLAKSGGPRSLEASARAVVEGVLARNAHQKLHKAVYADGTLAGAPAYSAEIMGVSPVSGKGEWAKIVSRLYGDSQIFHVILVSPSADRGTVEPALDRIRASLRLRDGTSHREELD